MIDRYNRAVLILIGLVLLAGGGLSACLGGGLFGSTRADRAVFDRTVVRWWNEGGWKSFAVVVAIGVIGAVLGSLLAVAQMRRNDARRRSPNLAFPDADGQRGRTLLRSPSLSHTIESDLKNFPGVRKAMVGLFGNYPDIEMRTLLELDDNIKLDELASHVDGVLERVKSTTGTRPQPLQVTARFASAKRERQLA